MLTVIRKEKDGFICQTATGGVVKVYRDMFKTYLRNMGSQGVSNAYLSKSDRIMVNLNAKAVRVPVNYNRSPEIAVLDFNGKQIIVRLFYMISIVILLTFLFLQ